MLVVSGVTLINMHLEQSRAVQLVLCQLPPSEDRWDQVLVGSKSTQNSKASMGAKTEPQKSTFDQSKGCACVTSITLIDMRLGGGIVRQPEGFY